MKQEVGSTQIILAFLQEIKEDNKRRHQESDKKFEKMLLELDGLRKELKEMRQASYNKFEKNQQDVNESKNQFAIVKRKSLKNQEDILRGQQPSISTIKAIQNMLQTFFSSSPSQPSPSSLTLINSQQLSGYQGRQNYLGQPLLSKQEQISHQKFGKLKKKFSK